MKLVTQLDYYIAKAMEAQETPAVRVINLNEWADAPVPENEDDMIWWVKYDQENNFKYVPEAMRCFERMDRLELCICGRPRKPYADDTPAMTCGDAECLRAFILGKNG